MMIDKVENLFHVGMDRKLPVFFRSHPRKDSIQLNLGAGNKTIDGTIPLDYPQWDADRDPIPFEDNSVDVIHAYHFLEHCKEPVKVLQECQRVLVSGGHINIVVPYYTSQMQAHDLDHKHRFCEETWCNLFDTKYYDKNRIEWEFVVGVNVIMGVVERNLCLMTQLIKR